MQWSFESNHLWKTYPYIKFSGPDSLGDAYSINHSTGDVEECHQHQPAQRGEINRFVKAVRYDVMHSRDNATQSQRNKDTWNKKKNQKYF